MILGSSSDKSTVCTHSPHTRKLPRTLASILYSTHKHKHRGLFWRLHHKSSADVLLWGQTRLSDVCSGARMKIMLSAVREWVRQKEKGFCLKARPRGRVGGNGTAIRFPPPQLMIGYKTRLMFWTVCVCLSGCVCVLFFPLFHAHTHSSCCPLVAHKICSVSLLTLMNKRGTSRCLLKLCSREGRRSLFPLKPVRPSSARRPLQSETWTSQWPTSTRAQRFSQRLQLLWESHMLILASILWSSHLESLSPALSLL